MPDYRRILWDGRRWILCAFLLFLSGSVLGLIVALVAPQWATAQLQPFAGLLRQVGERLAAETSPVQRTAIIFRNNGEALLRMMLLGLFPFPFFGFVPAAGTFFNGALIGVVLGLGTQYSPLAASPGLLLLATVPHGIIELPALWIGAAWGMKLGLAWLLPAARGQRLRVLGHSALETGQIFVLVSLMLLAAAAIEANVTLALVQQQAPAVRAATPGIL
ncbi:MAG TPA: stage II sporulation protein M [Chloroflexota bacterium]|nr:stage II sporulation protein M [Chloroflexota bacterium]